MKKINVILIENVQNILEDQMTYIAGVLGKEITASQDVSIVHLDNSIVLEKAELVKIVFSSAKIVIPTKDMNNQNDRIKDIILEWKKKHGTTPTLFVIDLCLDAEDCEPETGKRLGEAIKGANIDKWDILYTTEIINYRIGFKSTNEEWITYRALCENCMNRDYQSSAASVYTQYLKESITDEMMLKMIRRLLCSKFFNRQYIGAIMLKAFKMINQ